MVIHGKTLIGADGAAQIYRSQDSGIHWTAAPMPDPKATVVALASCGSLLFAGATNEGKPNDVPLYISQDDGASWKPTGLEGNRVTAVGCSGKQVVAGMWPRTVRESAPAQPSTSYPPGSPAAVMLGTGRSANTPQYRAVNLKGDPVGDMVHATLVVSNDGGETWELLRKTFDLVSVRVTDQRIEVFGRDNSVLAMPSAFVLNYCYDAQDKTCAKIYSKYSGALPTALQKMDQTVFVGTRAGSIMVSRNEGAAWKEMLLPLPTEAPAGNGAPRISGFPTSVDAMTLANHHVVAGTGEKGVYLSDIAGDNWTMVGEHALSRLRCLQYDGAFLYAGTLEGVYRIRLIEAEH